MTLPPRTANTMSDAIAIASPNGRMSRRAKEQATKQLGEALFGPGGLKRPGLPPQPSERERLVREALQCREHAARGMRPRANIKQAERCESRIAEIDSAESPNSDEANSAVIMNLRAANAALKQMVSDKDGLLAALRAELEAFSIIGDARVGDAT